MHYYFVDQIERKILELLLIELLEYCKTFSLIWRNEFYDHSYKKYHDEFIAEMRFSISCTAIRLTLYFPTCGCRRSRKRAGGTYSCCPRFRPCRSCWDHHIEFRDLNPGNFDAVFLWNLSLWKHLNSVLQKLTWLLRRNRNSVEWVSCGQALHPQLSWQAPFHERNGACILHRIFVICRLSWRPAFRRSRRACAGYRVWSCRHRISADSWQTRSRAGIYTEPSTLSYGAECPGPEIP